MFYCENCNAELSKNTDFCAECNTTINYTQKALLNADSAVVLAREFNSTTEYRFLQLLSYIGVLVIIPLYMARKNNSPFIKFHANQGFILFLSQILLVFVGIIAFPDLEISPNSSSMIMNTLLFYGPWLFGIISSVLGKTIKLPIIGKIKLIE